MASGDFYLFRDTWDQLFNGTHDEDNTFKLAFITNATTPDVDDAVPHFGGTGTTDLSTNETSGGNFPSGGLTLLSVALTITVSGIAKFDAADPSANSDASNPSAARWGILYNSTDLNKRCLGYLDLGTARDFTSGNFSWAIPANGIFRIGRGTIT